MGGRWIWRLLALPGVVWLSLFFVVALYAIVAVAFGNQNTLYEPVPLLEPARLERRVRAADVLENIFSGGQFLTVIVAHASSSSPSPWPSRS